MNNTNTTTELFEAVKMNDKYDFDEDACYERDIKWAEETFHDEIEDGDDDFDEDACYERDIKWAESMCHDEIDEDDDFDEDACYKREIEMAEYMLEINNYYENNYAA